jgi:hypothetical protein
MGLEATFGQLPAVAKARREGCVLRLNTIQWANLEFRQTKHGPKKIDNQAGRR